MRTRCPECDRLAEVVLPTMQMLERRVTALEQGTVVRREVQVRGKTLADIEREACIEALHAARGIQKLAADMLGVTPRVMSYKVKQLGLQRHCRMILDRS